jgi:predicted ThiF/HesA family dinucleotide-utilizing enzyme
MFSIIVFLVSLLTDSRQAIGWTAAAGIVVTMTFGFANRMRVAAELGIRDPDPIRLFILAVVSTIVVVLVARILRIFYHLVAKKPVPRFI